MNNVYIRKILTDEQVDNAIKLLKDANNSNYWVDGLNTGGGNKTVKNNLELSNLDIVNVINDYIMNSLDSDSNFINFTAAESTHLNIISKTSSGGYYRPHFDNWNNGDFSTTVFLNSPDDYVGGELCLLLDNKETKFKLDSGWGITYSTGIIHRVNTVISGSRYASVFWTKSIIKDDFIRELYYEISKCKDILPQSDIHISDCINANSDPTFILENLKNKILRKYSK